MSAESERPHGGRGTGIGKRCAAIVGVSACILFLAGGAQSLAGKTPHPASYLLPGSFSIVGIVPPAPQPGDVRFEADRRIFRETRALADSERWRLAINDVSERPEDLLRDFSCAAGLPLTPGNASRTTALLLAAAADTAKVNDEAKATFRRMRPFTIDEGPICQPAAEVANSYDYPSGHTTRAWTWATILAQLLPDRASAILARGRAYGESRIVCGVHNASAVEAGRLSSSSTLTVIEQNPRFKADFKAAQSELTQLMRSARSQAPSCGAADLFIPSIYADGALR